MSLINLFIEIHLKLKQYKLQFIFFFLFWFIGFLFFLITEPQASIGEIILYSLTVRNPEKQGDFANFYFLVWPILLEVIFFGFIMGELLEKYNPIVTSRVLAQHKRNHTVVIGYGHLSERIVDYCIEKKKPYCVIEDCEEKVEDLINTGQPIVVGDGTEESNLNAANIKRANEVFITVDDVRYSIVCTEKIREINPDCHIYVRAFADHVQEYLRQPPFRAFSFSTSKWAMERIIKWTEGKTGKVIVIGRDSLTHRIAHHISLQPGREVFLFDDEHEGIEFVVSEQLHIIHDLPCFLSDLRAHINLEEISQTFICWKRESEFDKSLYLASKFHLRYPHMQVYVRIFDEELIALVKNYNAKTFSSSQHAFKRLQEEVHPNSSIYPKVSLIIENK
ncbi:MAG: NAD-binding protein [Promethearchaeota archaeon]